MHTDYPVDQKWKQFSAIHLKLDKQDANYYIKQAKKLQKCSQLNCKVGHAAIINDNILSTVGTHDVQGLRN